MEELLDCNQLNTDCKQLLQFWQEYGHGPESLEKRKKTVNKYTKELFKDMVQEEEKRVTEKKMEIQELENDIQKLLKQLEMQYEQKTGSNLLVTIDMLEKYKQKLIKTKEEKMKDWMEAKKREEMLCTELEEIVSADITDRIPTGVEVSSLVERIRSLTKLKSNRTKTFNEISDKVIKFLDLLEKSATNMKEIDETLKNKVPILTAKFLEPASMRKIELEEEYNELQSKWDTVLNEIRNLWDRLEIDVSERIEFGIQARPSVFEKMTVEHCKLLELKKANLKSFITKLRDEIQIISKSCYRTIELPIEEETDACLEEHEQLLKSLQDYKATNQIVLDLIEKRNDVFMKWKECEMRADDPSRFNNRGGQLLKEEKIRKTLQKSLPKMEKEIEESGFMMFETNVSDWLKREWDDWNLFREEVKRKRKEEAAIAGGADNLMNTTRKRPATPLTGQAKRTRGTPLTPRKNPVVLDPASTYTDFQNHNIFQSTMNKGEPKSPSRPPSVVSKSPIRGGDATRALKFTTPKNTRLNENF